MGYPDGRRSVPRMIVSGLFVVGACFTEVSSRAAAGGTATPRLATILLSFTHVATQVQMEELQAIVHGNTTTVHERVVAEVLLHMEHIVSLEDRPRLETVIRDGSAPEGIRILASIVAHMTHTLTAPERERVLKVLTQRERK